MDSLNNEIEAVQRQRELLEEIELLEQAKQRARESASSSGHAGDPDGG